MIKRFLIYSLVITLRSYAPVKVVFTGVDSRDNLLRWADKSGFDGRVCSILRDFYSLLIDLEYALGLRELGQDA